MEQVENIYEINLAFLLELPYPDLLNACQAKIFWANICNDPYFWREKAQLDFGSNVLQLKPTNWTDRKFYEDYYQKLSILQKYVDQIIQAELNEDGASLQLYPPQSDPASLYDIQLNFDNIWTLEIVQDGILTDQLELSGPNLQLLLETFDYMFGYQQLSEIILNINAETVAYSSFAQ